MKSCRLLFQARAGKLQPCSLYSSIKPQLVRDSTGDVITEGPESTGNGGVLYLGALTATRPRRLELSGARGEGVDSFKAGEKQVGVFLSQPSKKKNTKAAETSAKFTRNFNPES